MNTVSSNVIKYPLSNEKSIRLMESENKLLFVVDMRATKAQIKSSLENLYGAKIVGVNTHIARDGTKRAFVKFAIEKPAIDIATDLGLL